MKIKASLLALSLAATGAVAAPQAVAQEAATKTMAELYDPSFEELSQPFGSDSRSDSSEEISISEIPEDARIVLLPSVEESPVLNPNHIHHVDVSVGSPHSLKFLIMSHNSYPVEGVEVTPKLLITYPDGSTEIVRHTFTVKPYQKYTHSVYTPRKVLTPGKQEKLPVQGLPKDARVTLLEAPSEWNASLEGHTLTVKPETEGKGQILINVNYPDGSSEPATLRLYAGEGQSDSFPGLDNPDRPRGSGAPLPRWSIAIITASVLAVFGGIAAYLLPHLTR